MRSIVKLAVSATLALFITCAAAVRAGEALDINGVFVGAGLPTGWAPNKPGYWDNEGKVVLTEVSDLDKTALRLTSVSRAMSLYTSARQFTVKSGDKVAVTCLMRGEGAGSLGVYYYPGGGWLKQEFGVASDWSEFAAELTLPDGVETIRVVIGIPPRSSTEFLDLTAELTRSGKPQTATEKR
jgi:hypothetical protein